MGIMAFNIRANTTTKVFHYRDFVVEESINGWEWSHNDYAHPGVGVNAIGNCQTAFECFEKIEAWYDLIEYCA